MLSKGDLMELTNNTTGVDSALPEPLVDQLQKMGLDRHDILYSYAMSYKDNSFGKLVNLSIALLELLDKTPINIIDSKGEAIDIGNNYTMMDFIKSLIQNPDYWEIKVK